MFSFFKSKKPSPPSSPGPEPIPGPNSDGFVVVDPRPDSQPNPSLYPNFNGHFGSAPHHAPHHTPDRVPSGANSPPINYLSGVPFKLSSELSTGDSNEIMKIQVDDILAIITSKMQVEDKTYDFGLERSVIAQG